MKGNDSLSWEFAVILYTAFPLILYTGLFPGVSSVAVAQCVTPIDLGAVTILELCGSLFLLFCLCLLCLVILNTFNHIVSVELEPIILLTKQGVIEYLIFFAIFYIFFIVKLFKRTNTEHVCKQDSCPICDFNE